MGLLTDFRYALRSLLRARGLALTVILTLKNPNPDFLFDVGAGPLFDVGPYYLTGLVTLFGPIARVSAARFM